MPTFNNIRLTADDVQTAPEGFEDGQPFHVHVDAELMPHMGGIVLHSVRRTDGTRLMLSSSGKCEVKRQIHLRHEDSERGLPDPGMNALRMDASVERGMFG